MRTLALLVPLLALLLSSLAFAQSSPKTGGTLRFSVKNLIPHQVVYNCCRLQEVWVDK